MSAEATAPVSTTPSREFTTIGVVGLGTMGAGIAEVFARDGYEVVGVEIDEETLDRGRQHVTNSTDRAVARGKLSESSRASSSTASPSAPTSRPSRTASSSSRPSSSSCR